MTRIVVLGGGFAGTEAILRLHRHLGRRPDVDLLLVSDNNYLLFTPLLPQVASSLVEPRHIIQPIRDMRGSRRFRFRRDRVVDIDLTGRRVIMAEDTVEYDRIVIAMGGVTPTFGVPGVEEHALHYKWLEDALLVRDHLIDLAEHASHEPDSEARRRLLTVCVVCIARLRQYAVAREAERGLASGENPMGGQILAGLKLVAKEPLLRWLALLVVLGVGIGTLLYNEQNRIARTAFATAEERAAFFSTLDLAVNSLTLVVQLLVTRALMSRFGIAPALLIPGVAIILGFSILAASPLPMLVAVVQVFTRASEFSLAKPARETIYTRVGREWRYKAGAAIDTVIYRGADLTFVWLHKFLSALGSSAVFGFGVLVAGMMTFSALQLLRQEKKLPGTREAAPVAGAEPA